MQVLIMCANDFNDTTFKIILYALLYLLADFTAIKQKL